jgi:cobalt-zinc-cadmium resistance protein CzcA
MFPASEVPRANIRSASIPDKLISYGLSLAQVEQQLTNNNANAGGSFIEAGLQQINIRGSGTGQGTCRISKTQSS